MEQGNICYVCNSVEYKEIRVYLCCLNTEMIIPAAAWADQGHDLCCGGKPKHPGEATTTKTHFWMDGGFSPEAHSVTLSSPHRSRCLAACWFSVRLRFICHSSVSARVSSVSHQKCFSLIKILLCRIFYSCTHASGNDSPVVFGMLLASDEAGYLSPSALLSFWWFNNQTPRQLLEETFSEKSWLNVIVSR